MNDATEKWINEMALGRSRKECPQPTARPGGSMTKPKLGRPRGHKTIEGLRLVAEGLTVYAAAKRLKMPSQQLYKAVHYDRKRASVG